MRILFLDGTKGFYPTRLDEKPCGGILTSLTLIPRYLASKGIEVHVLSEHDKNEAVADVHYIQRPIEKNIYDVVVLNRNMLNRQIITFFRESRRIWWLHDIVDYRYCEDDAFRFVDTVVALSDYQRWSYHKFYELPLSRFVVISNGVDKSVFFPPDTPARRNRSLFVHASAPVKGTYPIPFTLHNLRRNDPKIEVRSYASQGLHGLEETGSQARVIASLKDAGVNVLPPIPQRDLAEVFRTAWALLMPNHYPEMNSNILLQAMACGLPVVASNVGSAAEFVKHRETGMLTETTPSDWYLWWADFARQCVLLQIDDRLHERISSQCPAGIPSWDEIGEEWYQMLVKESVAA